MLFILDARLSTSVLASTFTSLTHSPTAESNLSPSKNGARVISNSAPLGRDTFSLFPIFAIVSLLLRYPKVRVLFPKAIVYIDTDCSVSPSALDFTSTFLVNTPPVTR